MLFLEKTLAPSRPLSEAAFELHPSVDIAFWYLAQVLLHPLDVPPQHISFAKNRLAPKFLPSKLIFTLALLAPKHILSLSFLSAKYVFTFQLLAQTSAGKVMS